MEYSYKFRIYPNAAQENLIQRTFGCSRFVFNHFLAERMEQYEKTGKAPTRFQQDKELTALKKELLWLKEVDATALQASLQMLDTAYQNFFRRVKQGEKPGYPRFKSKHNHRRSYKSKCVGTNIKVLDGAMQLPKLGNVKCRVSRKVEGRVLSATVSQEASGKYYVSLCCTDVDIKPLPKTGAAVGIDLGIKDLAITSDGVKYDNLHSYRRNLKKLARLQR
jgi:putative transposase